MASETAGERLSGRVALVTGAGSGVGRAVSARFLAEGARVCAFDLRPEGLVELIMSAEVLGGAGALPPAADVAARVPLERTPELAALTEAFVLLAGDGAGTFMTGAELTIDSGQRLGGPPARR